MDNPELPPQAMVHLVKKRFRAKRFREELRVTRPGRKIIPLRDAGIKYPYPNFLNHSPFDETSPLRFFAAADGYTYLGRYEDFEDPFVHPRFRSVIPMGYKSIFIVYRQALYAGGRELWRNSSPIPPVRPKVKGVLCRVFTDKVYKARVEWSLDDLPREVFELLVPSETRKGTWASGNWSSPEAASEAALAASRKNPMTFLVGQVIEWRNWH